MATFGTKQVLINEPSAWGMSGDANTLKIPGFGTFDIADMINVSAVKGAAATKGVYKYTIAGGVAEAANMAFTIDVASERFAAENARKNITPGNKYVFGITLNAGDTPATIAEKLRTQMQERIVEYGDLPFTVSGAAAEVILTMKDEYTQVKNANTGFEGAPYVESVETGREIPQSVTAALATVTAPVAATGLGKDLEENEFLSTSESVGPYAMELTDRPILSEVYNQFHFDIPRTFRHEVQGAPDAIKGSVSFSVFVLKSKEAEMAATWDAIGAKSVVAWEPINAGV